MDTASGGFDFLVVAAFFLVGQAALVMYLRRRAVAFPWWASVLAIVLLLAGLPLLRLAERREHARLRVELTSYASMYAAEMEHLGHAALSSSPAADDPLYLSLIDAEKRWLAANRVIADVYTVRRRDDGTIFFLVDSETDYDRNGIFEGERERRTTPGEVYDDPGDGLQQAFAGKTTFSSEPTTDRWGTTLSAQAPLRDSSGKVDAVLGVDYEAERWLARVDEARELVVGLWTSVLFMLLVVAAVLATLRTRAIERGAAAARFADDAALLARTNDSLREAIARAESEARVKSDFLATMSHEIRTPMNGVMGMNELLLATQLSAEQRQFATTIRKSADHLLSILNRLLDFSKIEAGRVVIEELPFDLRAVVEDVVDLAVGRAKEKGLRVHLVFGEGIPAELFGDAVRVRQVLINLVSNATKFTDDGEVEVSVALVDKTATEVRVRIRVRDTGIGIPLEKQGELFQKFVQVDSSTTRRFGGTGLGLAIVRELVDLMGGTVSLQSRPGEGSTFCVELPLALVAAASTSVVESTVVDVTEPTVSSYAAVRPRVLVAEDNAVNQAVITRMLATKGCDIALAVNGREAVDMVRAGNFDLVLMDLMMPEMDGLEATQVIRREEAGTRRVPIVAVSAAASEADRVRCLAAGMDDFLSKPMSLDDLSRVLGRWLAARA